MSHCQSDGHGSFFLDRQGNIEPLATVHGDLLLEVRQGQIVFGKPFKVEDVAGRQDQRCLFHADEANPRNQIRFGADFALGAEGVVEAGFFAH